MKLVQNLPEIFEEFGEQRRKAFLDVKEYKDKGIPVIGMYCAYFPTELAMAVGAIPVGLCSFSNERLRYLPCASFFSPVSRRTPSRWLASTTSRRAASYVTSRHRFRRHSTSSILLFPL